MFFLAFKISKFIQGRFLTVSTLCGLQTFEKPFASVFFSLLDLDKDKEEVLGCIFFNFIDLLGFVEL